MATIKQIQANRRNAQRSTGPRTPEGKQAVRFNALTHGIRAESVIIPGEDQSKFNEHLARLSAAWLPQDEMEKSLVEQIAANQWKLARLDRSEARLYEAGALDPAAFVMAIHRLYLTQARLERCISTAVADLERYRKVRLARREDLGMAENNLFQKGIIYGTCKEDRTFFILPQVRGLDGEWRDVPREALGDFPKPPEAS